MVANTGWLSSSSTTNSLYIGLLVAAILTFVANLRSAAASLRLAKRQDLDATARESSDRPNLQLYDHFISNRSSENIMAWQRPLTILIMNFGHRAAKVNSATFSLFGVREEVEIRTASCLRHDEAARFRVDLGNQMFRRASGAIIERDGPDLMLESKVNLTLRYSEADGSNEVQATISFPFYNLRHNFANQDVTLHVLRNLADLSEGDRPG